MYGKGPHGCPRGFEWNEEKEECTPERAEVKDKLKKENQRYFFKEGNTMDKIDKLVDEVFDGGFDQFGKVRTAEKQVDKILDALLNENTVDFGKGDLSTTGRPYDHPIKMKVVPTLNGKSKKVTVDECGGPMMVMGEEEFEDSEYGEGPAQEENPRKLQNDINHVPDQNVAGLLKSVHGELSEAQVWKTIAEMRISENYKKYFKLMLKKHGYNSPADIPPEKKKAFFNAVDKGWKGLKEQMRIRQPQPSIRPSSPPPRQGGFGSIRGSDTRGGFGSIRGTKTSGGFGSIRGYKNRQEEQAEEVDESGCEKKVSEASAIKLVVKYKKDLQNMRSKISNEINAAKVVCSKKVDPQLVKQCLSKKVGEINSRWEKPIAKLNLKIQKLQGAR